MTAPQQTRPAVAQLVSAVTAAAELGEVWVIPTAFGQAALITPDGQGGYRFAGQFRRANLHDATGAGLLTARDLTAVPRFSGGDKWAWTHGAAGWNIELARSTT